MVTCFRSQRRATSSTTVHTHCRVDVASADARRDVYGEHYERSVSAAQERSLKRKEDELKPIPQPQEIDR